MSRVFRGYLVTSVFYLIKDLFVIEMTPFAYQPRVPLSATTKRQIYQIDLIVTFRETKLPRFSYLKIH